MSPIGTDADTDNETTEVKHTIPYRDVDDSLSEWERSRQTSKTWSMEQD